MNKRLLEFFKQDKFREFLGAEIVEVKEGYAKVEGIVREEFTNFHGTAHGSFIGAMADFALAIAANSDNIRRFAATIKIDFYKPAYLGDKLTAESRKTGGGTKLGFYETKVFKRDELIAKSDAIAYGKAEIVKK
ncbi:MAG TPA: hotdog fold thioesterase [Archaeoglobaceae archaeon]|nr:hotdog fold thioesterase [Archaeoglobaceae archaeon]